MKKFISHLLVASLASCFLLTPSVFADGPEENEIKEEKEIQNQKYLELTGTIEKITEEKNGQFFATVEGGEKSFGFYFNQNSKIYTDLGKEVSSKKLKEGITFSAFIDKDKPMIMIYPPKYSPDFIIVYTNEGTVQLDKFDQNFLNQKKDLVIFIEKDTSITNLSGTKMNANQIVEKDVLIFYQFVLESYPGQTNPTKIIVLENDLSNIEKAKEIAKNDNYVVDGIKMIPLRLVAEQLGYRVKSTGNGAIVSKDTLSFTITRGTKLYKYNKAIHNFEVAPELLEKNKTYVPYGFLSILVNQY